MMGTGASGSRRGGIPAGLIGMLALVVGVERFVADHPFGFMGDPQRLAWRMSERAIRGEAARAEVLCLGDSLVKFGILPRVLEAGLGRSAYNLAIPGAQPAASYFLFRRALTSGARPRAVVVDFYSKVLAAAPRINRCFWPDLLSFGELLELSCQARDIRLFNESAVGWLLPSFRDRGEIRRAVLATVKGEGRQLRDTLSANLRNGLANRGATVAPVVLPSPVDYETGSRIDPSRQRRWAPARPNAEFVRRFLDLARDHGIPVFWVLPPTSPRWQERIERRGEEAAYLRFVRGTRARAPNVVILDGRHTGYGRELFCDPVHLNRAGASAFTADVASAIALHLAGSGPRDSWVALPAYRDRPPVRFVEDLVQSEIAVRSAESTRLR